MPAATSLDDLAEATTEDILFRLPVKDIIRLTALNKAWYSFITKPSFISAQISHCISHCDESAVLIIPSVIFQNNNYCSLISADTSSRIEKFDIPFVTRSNSLNLVAEVHGLLLITEFDELPNSSGDLYLWNPYVKRHRVVVSSCFKKLLDDRVNCYYVVGMGFDKLSNDCKIVRIVYVSDDWYLSGKVDSKVEIYSMKNDTWRNINNAVVPGLSPYGGTYVDGSFYWFEREQRGIVHTWRIFSFDFVTEVFGEFKVPDDVADSFEAVTSSKLMEFEGSLAFCVLETQRCRIWLMRKENGVISWTLRFEDVLKKFGRLLNITKNGTLIIETWNGLIVTSDFNLTSINSCNLNSMVEKDLGFGKRISIDLKIVASPDTVGTSLQESLIMYREENRY